MSQLSDPGAINALYNKLAGKKEVIEKELKESLVEVGQLNDFLRLEDKVLQALEKLDGELFKNITNLLETKLTIALQEILEQDIRLKVEPIISGKSIGFKFRTLRNGCEEDIMRGNGGSVVNILSVCLRLFALTQLPNSEHRRFLVLDEQDCWIEPTLVPRFAKIIHESAKALGFQILIISHHSSSIFQEYSDRIFKLIPSIDGVKIETLNREAVISDQIFIT